MITRRALLSGFTFTASTLTLPLAANSKNFGTFRGKAKLTFIGKQLATVDEALTFIDPDGLQWTTPRGVKVNGASIPWQLWSVVGAPFSGNYLRASIIHDHYCVSEERDWRATHYVFYNGCRADGLSSIYSKLLYAGVMSFGPRWGEVRAGEPVPRYIPEFNEEQFKKLRRFIEKEDPPLRELNRRLF